jgi:hypothetical protein
LEVLRTNCPNVRELFLGLYDDDGGEVVKRASLGIWLDGKHLKYVITPKDHGDKGWGVVRDAGDILGSIEADIVEDKVDWKGRKEPGQELTPY